MITVILVGTSLVVLLLGKSKAQYFVLAIPLIHIVTDILISYSIDILDVNAGLARGLLIIPFLVLALFKIKLNSINIILYTLLLYLLIMITMSSNFEYSLWQFAKFCIAILMYPIAYHYIDSFKNFQRLNKILLIGVSVIIINFLVGFIYGIGISPYSKILGIDVFIGTSNVQVTYILTYVALCIPLIINTSSINRSYLIILISIMVVQILVTFRRSSILGLIVGMMAIVWRTKYRVNSIILIFVMTVTGWFFYSMNEQTINTIIFHRLNIYAELSSDTGRINEFKIVSKPFQDGNVKEMFFGSELFNTYNLKEFVGTDGYGRPLHVDYNVLLNGAGIIGLFLYLLILFKMFNHFRKAYKQNKSGHFIKILYPTVQALFLANLIFSSSNQIWSLSALSIFFMYIGSLTGILDKDSHIRFS